MVQNRNPQFDALLFDVGPNNLGSDLIRVQSSAGGGAVVWRLNQFMTSVYDGFGVPGNTPDQPNYQAGVLVNHLYTDLSTGFLWYWNGTVWVQLTSGGGGGSCSPDDVVPGQILSASVIFGGSSGYTTGDTSAVNTGNGLAIIAVTASGGVVTGATIISPGSYYLSGPALTTTVLTGTGDGTLTISADTVTVGTSGDFLYNNSGTCGGTIFNYGEDVSNFPAMLGQVVSGGNEIALMSLSPVQLIFQDVNGEDSLTATLTFNSLSFSPNTSTLSNELYSQFSFSQASFFQNNSSISGTYQASGINFDDFLGNPAGAFSPSINGSRSTNVDFYGATSGTVKLTANPIAGSTMPICLPDSDPAESGDVLVTDAGTGGDCWFGTGQQLSWVPGGGNSNNIVAVTTDYGVLATDNTIEASNGAAITLQAPSVPLAGQPFTIINTDASLSTTITATGGATINGLSSWVLTNQYQFITVKTNAAGTAYLIVNQN